LQGRIDLLLDKPFTFLLQGNHKKTSLHKAIDAFKVAKLGYCLLAYANFAGPGTYYFHGGTIVTTGHILANAEMVTENDRIRVRSIKEIRPGEEILFVLGEYWAFLPKDNILAARYNMNLPQLPVYQSFKPVEVESVLKKELPQVDYNRALSYLAFLREKFKNGQRKEVLFIRYSIPLNVETMLRY